MERQRLNNMKRQVTDAGPIVFHLPILIFPEAQLYFCPSLGLDVLRVSWISITYNQKKLNQSALGCGRHNGLKT